MTVSVLGVAQRHWFYLVLPLLLGATIAFRETHPWRIEPRLGEATTLFDWCLFVPLLFAICYRDMPPRALCVRILAAACGGIWIAGRVVPDHAQMVLTEWGWLHGIGIAVLTAFEGVTLIAVLRIVFGAAPDPAALERQGIPPLLVKLMLAEARFWRHVWNWLAKR